MIKTKSTSSLSNVDLSARFNFLKKEAENILYFDTETTGLSSHNADPKLNKEIVELALVDCHGNTVYHSLFKPEEPISSTLAIVNNIDNDMVEDAPYWSEEWAKIRSLMDGKTIVGFNIDSFDSYALKETCERYGINMNDQVSFSTVDIMPLFLQYTELFPTTQSRNMMIKQEVARKIIGLDTVQTHRADNDCRELLELVETMISNHEKGIKVNKDQFLNGLQKPSVGKKFENYLKKEERTQELMDCLQNHVSMDAIAREFSDLGSHAEVDNLIMRMNKKGLINYQEDLKIIDPVEYGAVEDIFEKTKDIGKTAALCDMPITKVRNRVMQDIPKVKVEEKTTTFTTMEAVPKDDLEVLNEYSNLSRELAIAKSELCEYEEVARKTFEEQKQNASCLVQKDKLHIEYSPEGIAKNVFDKEKFKNECPMLYDECLVRNDQNELVYTKPRQSMRFTLKEEFDYTGKIYNLRTQKAINRMNDLSTQIARGDQEIEALKPLVKEILIKNDISKLDLKLGRFSYSMSEPNPKFDAKAIRGTEVYDYYVKKTSSPDKVKITSTLLKGVVKERSDSISYQDFKDRINANRKATKTPQPTKKVEAIEK